MQGFFCFGITPNTVLTPAPVLRHRVACADRPGVSAVSGGGLIELHARLDLHTRITSEVSSKKCRCSKSKAPTSDIHHLSTILVA